MVLWSTWKLFYYFVMKWIPLHTHTWLYCHGNWDPTVKYKDWSWWGRWQSLGTTVLEKFVFLLPAGLRVIIKMSTFLWFFPLMIASDTSNGPSCDQVLSVCLPSAGSLFSESIFHFLQSSTACDLKADPVAQSRDIKGHMVSLQSSMIRWSKCWLGWSQRGPPWARLGCLSYACMKRWQWTVNQDLVQLCLLLITGRMVHLLPPTLSIFTV